MYSHHDTILAILVYTKFSLNDAKIYTWGFLKCVFSFNSQIFLFLLAVLADKYIFPFKSNIWEKYVSIGT